MIHILTKLIALPGLIGSTFAPAIVANEQNTTQTQALSLSEIVGATKLFADVRPDTDNTLLLTYIFENNVQILKELAPKCKEILPYQDTTDCPLSFEEGYNTYKDPTTSQDWINLLNYEGNLVWLLSLPLWYKYSLNFDDPVHPLLTCAISLDPKHIPDAVVFPEPHDLWYVFAKYVKINTEIDVSIPFNWQ